MSKQLTGELWNSSVWNTEMSKIMISYRLKYNRYRYFSRTRIPRIPSVCIIYYYYIIINLIATLYCPKVYFSPCTTCINTASVGAAIVVSRVMWRQSAELGVHRSSTSSRVGSHGFDWRSSALSRVEGWKNTGYGLPGTQHKVRRACQSTIVGAVCTELHHSDRNLRTAWFEKEDFKIGIKKKTLGGFLSL